MKVFIVATVTADGFMGETAGHNSRDWRSKDDGKLFSRLIKYAGVMVMGSTTYSTFRTFRAPFGQRLIVYTRHPEKLTMGPGVETSAEDPKKLVEQLEREGYKGLAICGGAQINTLFLESGVVNEIYLTFEPVLFGDGIPLLTQFTDRRLTLLDSRTFRSGAITAHYAVE